jgi:hypothetical protein
VAAVSADLEKKTVVLALELTRMVAPMVLARLGVCLLPHVVVVLDLIQYLGMCRACFSTYLDKGTYSKYQLRGIKTGIPENFDRFCL